MTLHMTQSKICSEVIFIFCDMNFTLHPALAQNVGFGHLHLPAIILTDIKKFFLNVILYICSHRHSLLNKTVLCKWSLCFFWRPWLSHFHMPLQRRVREQVEWREREIWCKAERSVMRIGFAHRQNHGNPSALPWTRQDGCHSFKDTLYSFLQASMLKCGKYRK